MTLPPEVIKAMIEAGASNEVIVAACEAAESKQERQQDREQERKRARWRQQQRDSRSRREAAWDAKPRHVSDVRLTDVSNVSDVRLTSLTSPPSFSPSTPTPITTPPAAAAEAGARANVAFEIANQIAVAGGILDVRDWPARWCGSPHIVEAWLAEGWRPDVILRVARAIMHRRRGVLPESVRYFEKPIRAAHDECTRKLPLFGTVSPKGEPNERPQGIVEAARRRLVELAELKRQRDAGPDDGANLDREGGASDDTSRPDVRLLSKG
jgi:hypothetical protein